MSGTSVLDAVVGAAFSTRSKKRLAVSLPQWLRARAYLGASWPSLVDADYFFQGRRSCASWQAARLAEDLLGLLRL
jgi:hypothetical protein